MIGRTARWIKARARHWARRRQGADPDPVTLHRRRIYILPTRFGMTYGLLVFVILMGSMNYNNNLGLALAFLLASLGLVAMHHCHRNLVGITLKTADGEPVFVGQQAQFSLLVRNTAGAPRYDLQLAYEGEVQETCDIPARGQEVMTLETPAPHRGLLALERVSLATTHPMGLFRAWAWVYMDLHTVVYPQPADPGLAPPPVQTDTGGARDDRGGDRDFAGLRPFRDGDSPRHVAWKAFAREQELLVKQFSGTDVTSHWFDWDAAPQTDTEGRLAQLCRWIVDARVSDRAYGLRLPDQTIEPNMGAAHARRCLTALALF